MKSATEVSNNMIAQILLILPLEKSKPSKLNATAGSKTSQ